MPRPRSTRGHAAAGRSRRGAQHAAIMASRPSIAIADDLRRHTLEAREGITCAGFRGDDDAVERLTSLDRREARALAHRLVAVAAGAVAGVRGPIQHLLAVLD